MLRNNSHPNIDISYPKYIIFHDYIKLSTHNFNIETINLISFNKEKIQQVMTIESLEAIAQTYNTVIDLSYYREFMSENYNLIAQSFIAAKIDTFKVDIIKADILENTYFVSSDSWHITNLIRKYKLSSYDVFLALLSGYNFDSDEIKNTYNEHKSNNGYKYIDYFLGVGIKCKFPDDVNANSFDLNMRRYNDRNENMGYYYIIKLLSDNFDKRSDDFC
jgi:hypothetical protein